MEERFSKDYEDIIKIFHGENDIWSESQSMVSQISVDASFQFITLFKIENNSKSSTSKSGYGSNIRTFKSSSPKISMKSAEHRASSLNTSSEEGFDS